VGFIMKSFLLGAVALVAMTAAASAADLGSRMVTKAPPIPQVYNWTGPYVGIQGGYGWGNSDQTDPGIPSIGDGSFDVRGGVIGGTLGYNWQSGTGVFGIEGDYSWSNIKGSSDTCGLSLGNTHSCGTTLDSFGTLRARAGVAFGPTGNWLAYVTGGLAGGDVHAWDNLTPASGSQFMWGWTAGAGIETAFAPNWTFKVEYLYLDLGDDHLFDIVPGVPETVSFRSSLIRAGVNYKF
jgi:outer membrane immunogenic protein